MTITPSWNGSQICLQTLCEILVHVHVTATSPIFLESELNTTHSH